MEWQPIETAPKDKPVRMGWWDIGYNGDMQWKEASGIARTSFWSFRGLDYSARIATHWKPLPNPPEDM